MKKKALLTFVYGLLIFIGGIFGFTKAGSLASLIMGTGFFLLLLISAIGEYKKSTLAFFSAVILCAILTCFFFWRFMETEHSLKNGILTLISLLVVLTLALLPNEKQAK